MDEGSTELDHLSNIKWLRATRVPGKPRCTQEAVWDLRDAFSKLWVAIKESMGNLKTHIEYHKGYDAGYKEGLNVGLTQLLKASESSVEPSIVKCEGNMIDCPRLTTAQERIVALETNINEGNLLMQRFTDGDILYSREEVPVTMKGLAAKLHKEQATIATLTDDLASLNKHYELYVDKYVKATAERDAARAALSDMIDDHVLPYPEPYWDDYPKYKARNDAARERLANAKAALLGGKEDCDETKKK